MATQTTSLPKYFPSLSENGWVSDALQKADLLFAQFMISEYSQTTIYFGKVSSLAYIIQEGSGDPLRTAELLETTLSDYFMNYFNNVSCSVTYPVGQEGSRVYLNIALAFEDTSGKTYSLTKVATLENSKVLAVENLNNFGT